MGDGDVGGVGVQLHPEQLEVAFGRGGEIAEDAIVMVLVGLHHRLLLPHQGGLRLHPLHKAGIGDVQPFGHLDDGVDGGVALPLLHVGQDGLLTPDSLASCPKVRLRSVLQLLQIHGDDLSQIPIHLLAPFPVDKYIEQL